METDTAYARFLLDGQMAVVDDYLEIRPDAEERIRALAAAGRLTMGPWYILMDEFLVSGETIVRDLQMGMARARPSAARWTSATCPTCSATSPRCPRSSDSPGSTHAVVWRGVPAQVDQDRLLVGGPRRLDRPGRVPARRLRQRCRPARRRQGPRPARRRPRAGDRLVPPRRPAADERLRPPRPPAVARSRRRRGQRHPGRLRLRDHVARRSTSPTRRPTGWSWKGELRSGARANLLMGVPPTGSTSSGPPAPPSGPSNGGPSRTPPSSSRPTYGPPACSISPGSTSSATPPTTRSAPAPSTPSSTPSSTALPKPGRSPTASPAAP